MHAGKGLTKGRVKAIRLAVNGHIEISITCPAEKIPQPGQYLLANDPLDENAALGTPLFCAEALKQGFWATSFHPIPWNPGTNLDLVGPLGNGFELPGGLQRLGLVALGETVSRLMPLLHLAVKATGGITLFTDLSLPVLPTALEVSPLTTLPEALDWPDYLALDVPLARLSELRQILGLSDGILLPCPAQVLITTHMPCAGIGECGACAVQSPRGWKLVCEDGPVFNLKDLSW